MRTMRVFYHLLALVKRLVSRPCSAASLQHVLLPLQGFLQAVSNINIHFFSSSSTSPFFTWQSATQGSQHCPQNFDTFQARPESELPGKQANKKSIFSTVHFICFPSSSPHTLLASSLPALLLACQILQPILLSPINQHFAITCLGHAERYRRDNEDKLIGRSRRQRTKRGQKRHSYCATGPSSLFNCN